MPKPPFLLFFSVVAACASASTALAQADGLEVRTAVLYHDVNHPGADAVESGADIELQVLGPRMDALGMLGRPRPYVSAALNTAGDTSFAAVGVVWRRDWTPRWSGEIQFGYAIHDGEIDSTDPVIAASRLQLGSRDLFRTALGVDYRLSPDWSVGLQWTHLSHGEILGDGRNQGIDAAGIRVARRFGR
ncbi:MAG: acyloxyacyl hydrolase [Brevundimonas sp.]